MGGDGAKQRLAEREAARAVAVPDEKLSWWATLLKLLATLFPKWTSAYKEARAEFLEHQAEWEAVQDKLPPAFQAKVKQLYSKAKDAKVFEALELPDVLAKMEAATYLATIFEDSNWSKWDRGTFALSEDHGTLYRVWHNFLAEQREKEKHVPDDAKDFRWKDFDLQEVVDIFVLVEALLDG